MIRNHDTEIYLKNGQIIKIHSSYLKSTSNAFGGRTNLEWRKEGGRELIDIDVSEICAIVSIDYKKRWLIRLRKLIRRGKKS